MRRDNCFNVGIIVHIFRKVLGGLLLELNSNSAENNRKCKDPVHFFDCFNLLAFSLLVILHQMIDMQMSSVVQ